MDIESQLKLIREILFYLTVYYFRTDGVNSF